MPTAGPRNRTGPPGLDGDPGKNGRDGIDGKAGKTGQTPMHEWQGTEIRFKLPSGNWGPWTDLKGKAGRPGATGAPGSASDSEESPKLIVEFDCDTDTIPGQLLTVIGDNFVINIDDNDSLTIPNGIFGVGIEKPTPTKIKVIFIGIVGGYAGLTTGKPMFISITGLPTHTTPTTGMVQQIGWAVSTTHLFVQLLQPMRRS